MADRRNVAVIGGDTRIKPPEGGTSRACLACKRQVPLDALRRWEAREEPGAIWERAYPDDTPNPAILHSGEIVADE
ncbi:MAG TPA: hypothetical protein VFU63_09605 [Ktedonobacterales bacterium]|nr:hypothetical protein [Ktedonobacterales bacterium]